ncbi:MAG TPA: CapA family protein [Polyangia bacterium]|nr:CapA family protein [Polyangia bacterium]
MSRPARRAARGLLAFALLACLPAACGREPPSPEAERTASPGLATSRLVFGGDVFLGRRVNEALYDRKQRHGIFAGIRERLKAADLVVANGEGVISGGGAFTDKGEVSSYMYRAHPDAATLLADAGIDVVLLGNNHALDYGGAALVETCDRLLTAGLDYAGGGRDPADARRPAYRRIGDTVVAVVGADLTRTRGWMAADGRPGLLSWDMRRADHGEVARELLAVLVEARRRAHVVILSPHWGENWERVPARWQRELARTLVRGGYDAIVGHSSHYCHGIEVIDGRPVIHDAGNLLLDYGGGNREHQGFLWELEITSAGVTATRGLPLRLERNRTSPAAGERRDRMLAELTRLSAALGTTVISDGGEALVRCDPGGMRGPAGAADPPRRAVPERIAAAPVDTIVPTLPPGARPARVRFAEGVELVGYRLLLDELGPGSGQFVALYFTADRPPDGALRVHLEARRHREGSEPEATRSSHIPGDWLLPADRWPPGAIVQDWTLLQLRWPFGGEVGFHAGLSLGGRVLKPVESSLPQDDQGLALLGTATYRKGARRMFDIWADFRRSLEAP